MRNRRKIRYKITAAALISSMLGMSMAGSALAGPPTVATDEALYVNLDYYGNQVDSSVVKGVSLNGLRTFTDYGTYTDVTNMSNYAEPVISGDGVTWQLPEDSKERFYYECQLNNDEVVLPWNFDVSYKLNGIPKEAKDLVHANGLVEMEVHCIPNENAKEYYRNNMLLQVATMVNMEDVNAVEAPGSQTQALGTYKVVIFAAVPGEEKTFHIGISTTNFESMGLIMMMIPGTLDQMSEITDIKEVKDTVGDSTDKLLDGMNEILDTLDRISGGMNVAQAGLEDLQKARSGLDASKDEIIANADNSLDSLEAVNEKISQLAPDINTNKQSLDEINTRINAIVKTLRSSGNDFFDLAGKLSDLEDSLGDLRDDLNNSNRDEILDHLQIVDDQLEQINEVLQNIIQTAGGIPTELDEEDLAEQQETLSDLLEETYGILDDMESVVGSDAVDRLRSQLDAINGNGLGDAASLTKLAAAAKALLPVVNGLQGMVSDLERTLSGIRLDDGLESGQDAAGEISSIMGRIETLIGDVNDLNRTVNEDKAGFDLMLDDMAASLDQMSSGTSQVIALLRSVQNTARTNRSAVENGTKQTLDGLIDILEKAADTKGTSDKLKDANEDLRASVKDELDKIEDDTNLLEMDPSQSMISFTSDKNPSPASIQIILRTEEISEEDVNTNAVDIEPVPQNVGLWQRIVNVFVKIWDTVTGFFTGK